MLHNIHLWLLKSFVESIERQTQEKTGICKTLSMRRREDAVAIRDSTMKRCD